MKILLLVPALNFGGVEIGTVDLSKFLKKAGQEIVVVSSGGELVQELEKNNIKHIALPIHKKSLFTLLQIRNLVKVIKNEGVDVVHAQSRVPAWVAYFASKITHTPFVTSCHGYYSKIFFSNVMGWGRRVIVISKVIANHMINSFGVSEEKIRLVYRGVDLSLYNYQPNKYDAPKDKFRIVNIARITPLKGHKEFIRAISIVEKEIPNIEVFLVGSAEKKYYHYEKELYNLVSGLNLEDKIKFLGSRSDIPQILKDADLLVLSTQTPEAFGRVIIEAGAAGTCVCSSRIGGIIEIIEDKKDGLLFDAKDKSSMAEAIVTLLKNRDLMKECSQNLRRKVEERFSLERMVSETLKVYQEAINEKNILVIKLGGLGDLILAIPLLRALRKNFAQAKISLLINNKFEPIVRNCPYIDDLILFNRKSSNIFKLANDLKERGFNISIDLKNNNFTHTLAFLAKIPSRFGFSKGPFSLLLNHPQDLSINLKEEPVHQQGRILKALGISSFDTHLELWLKKEDDTYIEDILREKGMIGQDKLVGLVLEASKKWPTKNWPIENFSKLSQKLSEKNLKIILLGEAYSQEKADNFPKDKNIISFVGKTNLNQLISLIKRLDILVTSDSAAMHIAAALGVKIIALFGPTDPRKHIPPAEDIEVLVRQIECQPCYKRKCFYKQQLACLENISVDEIFSLVVKKLSQIPEAGVRG